MAGCGFADRYGVLAVPPFIGDFEDIAEPFGRYRGDVRATPFNQCVGGQRRAMNKGRDLMPPNTSSIQNRFGPLDRGDCWRIRRRRRLGSGQNGAVVVHKHGVRKRTTDVYRKPESGIGCH